MIAHYNNNNDILCFTENVTKKFEGLNSVYVGEDYLPLKEPYLARKFINGKVVYTYPKQTILTPRQARLALLQTGLLDELETAIANDRALGIWWEYSLDIRRDNPELLAFASSYGLTETQLDDLFELGASL